MESVENILYKTGIVPVIKIDNAEQAVPLAKALLAGGIHSAEITFRTPAAAKAIEKISENLPEMFVCAGTVLSADQAQLAASCGAKAIISPGTNPEVVAWCRERGMPVYPGCATPTEIESAMAMGLSTVKLFPAEVVGGVKMLKALAGPYQNIKFMPTGGISPENVTDYLKLPNVIACGGSWLCPGKAVEQSDWETITALAKEAAQLVSSVRG